MPGKPRDHGPSILWERRLGIKLPKGMKRTPESVRIPNLERMNRAINELVSEWSSNLPPGMRDSEKRTRAITDLFNLEAKHFWGRTEERWAYLADADRDTLGGAYPENLFYPDHEDRLFKGFRALVMKRCELKRQRHYYRQKVSLPVPEVDDVLRIDTRPSEGRPWSEIIWDPVALDPSLGSAFPPPVAPIWDPMPLDPLLRSAVPPPVASMLSHQAWKQQEVEVSHNTFHARSDAASPMANADLEGPSSARQSERGESAAEQTERSESVAEQTERSESAAEQTERSESAAEQTERGESAAEQSQQGESAAEQSSSHTERDESRPSLVVRLPICISVNGSPSSAPNERSAESKRLFSDDPGVARPSKAPRVNLPSQSAEDDEQWQQELDDVSRLRDKERERIERRTRKDERKMEAAERRLHELETRAKEVRAQKRREKEEESRKQGEELEEFREVSKRRQEECRRATEAAKEQMMRIAAELQALDGGDYAG